MNLANPVENTQTKKLSDSFRNDLDDPYGGLIGAKKIPQVKYSIKEKKRKMRLNLNDE